MYGRPTSAWSGTALISTWHSHSRHLQPHLRKRIPRLLIFLMSDPSYPQSFGHLHEHRPVIYINHLFNRDLGNIQRHPPDIRIRLPEMNETGRDKEIHKLIQPELPDPMLILIPLPSLRLTTAIFFSPYWWPSMPGSSRSCQDRAADCSEHKSPELVHGKKPGPHKRSLFFI